MFARCPSLSLLTLLVLSVSIELLASDHDYAEAPGIRGFFKTLDHNNDGQIETKEAELYIGQAIGGQHFDSQQKLSDAAQQMLGELDSGDLGSTVSVTELDWHLHQVLQGTRVSDWISHGLGLPQYEEAFKHHSVMPVDFPVLVEDSGVVLESELGVKSHFHKEKIVRAMRCQILGLGTPPAQPQGLTCTFRASPEVVVRWSPPLFLGQPPLHQYVLERLGAWGQWQSVAEAHDSTLAVDEVEADVGDEPELTYRVAAWNLYGRSPYLVTTCSRPAREPELIQPEDVHPLPAQRSVTAQLGSSAASGAAQVNSVLILILPLLLRLLPLQCLRVVRAFLLRAASLVQSSLSKSAQPSLLDSGRMPLGHVPQSPPTRHPSHPTSTNDLASLDPLGSGLLQCAGHSSSSPGLLALAVTSESGRQSSTEIQATPHDSFHRSGSEGDVAHLHNVLGPGSGSRMVERHISADMAVVGSFEGSGTMVLGSSPGQSGMMKAASRRKMCAHGGCSRKLDITHYRDYKQKHYCGRCQQVFCLEHTAYSPHGAGGSCGQESRCVCIACFAHFTRDYQAFLKQRNTLEVAGQALQAQGSSLGMNNNSPQLGKMLWARAVCKMKAVVRMSKGAHHVNASGVGDAALLQNPSTDSA